MVICMSDVLSYWKCEIRAFMEPWFWLVWWHTLAKWFCLLQFNYCFIHAGQAVECWEYVVPQPEQGLETFDFNFLFVQIRLAESVYWCGWAWSQSADSKVSAFLTVSLRDLRYSALARMFVRFWYLILLRIDPLRGWILIQLGMSNMNIDSPEQ